MTDGRLWVNGRQLDEPYAWHAEPTRDPVVDEFRWQRRFLVGPGALDTAGYTPSRNNWGPLVVPVHNVFVLGDNRDNSLDSRYVGFVPESDVAARVDRIYFSRDPGTAAIRWRRFGRRPH